MAGFEFIDLFAGIGGFRIAAEQLGGSCVFSSEIDKNARETYKANFGEVPFGDIREITEGTDADRKIRDQIPDHDLLTAGFPCQPFSRAGVSARNSLGTDHGFLDETQGTLFFDVARIIEEKRPRVVLLENVANIRSHDNGRTFSTIRGVLEQDLRYAFHSAVLNSSSLVPQRRKRCFMVAFRDGNPDFRFPELTGPDLPLRSVLEPLPPEIYTISDRLWEGHKRRTTSNRERGTGFTAFEADLEKPSNTIVARYYKDGKECLIPQEGKNPRFLTPRECARLQGFPEKFIPHSSRSAAYKQFGNAVTVPLVVKIMEQIIQAVPELAQKEPLHSAGSRDSGSGPASGRAEQTSQPRLARPAA